VFLEAAVGVTLITVLTIGYQSIRAALANPVRTLRSEQGDAPVYEVRSAVTLSIMGRSHAHFAAP
jgi:hypothetical protein